MAVSLYKVELVKLLHAVYAHGRMVGVWSNRAAAEEYADLLRQLGYLVWLAAPVRA